MSQKYNPAFKSTIVEKALTRGRDVTLEDICEEHGIAKSTISRWIVESQKQEINPMSDRKNKESRPQDWSSAERLQAIIDCSGLDEKSLSAWCRKQGLYPHHIKQWKAEFVSSAGFANSPKERTQLKQLKAENKDLKRELHRKEKALAETAALLVLKKKVHVLLTNGEDN